MTSEPVGAGDERRRTLDLALSTFAITAVALAQPLLDLLGRNPEFFVARASPALDVIVLGVVLAIGVPMLLAGIVVAVNALNRTAGRIVHAVLLAVMGGLLAMTVLEHTPAASLEGWAMLTLGGAAGVALAWGYQRSRPMRSLFRYLAIAPLVVAGAFLFIAPTSRLAWGSDPVAAPIDIAVASPSPVVMLVFDEFPVASLIDPEGNIQAEHFPNFARLASDGTWFRNAVGVHERTEEALPTIVTGSLAPLDVNTPRATDYPQSLFTLLGGTYQIDAMETVTELCPARLCPGRVRPGVGARWTGLGRDLAVVAGHVFLPADLTGGLPVIDQTWGGYAPGEVTEQQWNLNGRFIQKVEEDRRVTATRFLDAIDHPLDAHELHFVHLLLPHSPWTFLPDGRQYEVTGYPSGEDARWGDDPWLVAQARQRHLLQVQYADRVLGQVIERLEANASYDDALIVVVADHGVSFRPGMHWRIVDEENVGELVAVPLLVKRPHQDEGGIDDYRAETLDLVPTIADVIGVEIPWSVDGVSLFDPARPERTESTMIGSDRPVTLDADGGEKLEAARYHAGFFGDRGPFGLAPEGQADLLGREVASLRPVEEPGLSLTIDQDYGTVDLAADPLPVMMTGTVTGSGAGETVLALAFNGTVVAVTEPSGSGSFRAMIPPDALQEANRVEVLVVEGSGPDRSFRLATG